VNIAMPTTCIIHLIWSPW